MKGECKNATVRAVEAAKLARVLLVEQQVAESQYNAAHSRLCDVDDEWGADSLRAKTNAVVHEGLERMRAQIRAVTRPRLPSAGTNRKQPTRWRD